MIKKAVNALGLAALALSTGCASLVNDSHIPVAMSFSDGSSGECTFTNKRGVWRTSVPEAPMIRRSDDALRYDCTAEHGGTSVGAIQSRMGAEIAMSAIFLDFGITDAITDKHRFYDATIVIPMSADRDFKVGDPGRSGESSAADSRGTKPTKPLEADTGRLPPELLDLAANQQCMADFEQVLGASNSRGTHWRIDCGDGESIGAMCITGVCYAR